MANEEFLITRYEGKTKKIERRKVFASLAMLLAGIVLAMKGGVPLPEHRLQEAPVYSPVPHREKGPFPTPTPAPQEMSRYQQSEVVVPVATPTDIQKTISVLALVVAVVFFIAVLAKWFGSFLQAKRTVCASI